MKDLTVQKLVILSHTFLEWVDVRITSFSTFSDSIEEAEIDTPSLNRSQLKLHFNQPKHWQNKPPEIWKFVNDFLTSERMALDIAQKIYSQNKPKNQITSAKIFFRIIAHQLI